MACNLGAKGVRRKWTWGAKNVHFVGDFFNGYSQILIQQLSSNQSISSSSHEDSYFQCLIQLHWVTCNSGKNKHAILMWIQAINSSTESKRQKYNSQI